MDLKIKDEQLTKLQALVNRINKAQLELGQVEYRKFDLVAIMPKLRKDLDEFQKGLEEEYGNVNVNLQDGTITPVEDGANKKD